MLKSLAFRSVLALFSEFQTGESTFESTLESTQACWVDSWMETRKMPVLFHSVSRSHRHWVDPWVDSSLRWVDSQRGKLVQMLNFYISNVGICLVKLFYKRLNWKCLIWKTWLWIKPLDIRFRIVIWNLISWE